VPIVISSGVNDSKKPNETMHPEDSGSESEDDDTVRAYEDVQIALAVQPSVYNEDKVDHYDKLDLPMVDESVIERVKRAGLKLCAQQVMLNLKTTYKFLVRLITDGFKSPKIFKENNILVFVVGTG